MQLGINLNELTNFVKQTVGDTIDKREAKELGIEDKYNDLAEETSDEVNVDVALEDTDFVDAISEIYVEMKAQEEAENTTSEEEQKENQLKVKDKNNAGV